MPVIVNADDFGKSEEVNRAICEAFEKCYINHTTLMVNMPFAGEAIRLAEEKGFSDRVGLHLNLTEGFPISSGIRNNPLICKTDGSFNAAFCHNIKYRLYMDSLSISQIEEEFSAQLQSFLGSGFKTLHIDSHHHVHTDWPVFLALKRLSEKYRFSYIRPSRNLYHGGKPLYNVYKKLYNKNVKKLCSSSSALFGSLSDLSAYTEGSERRLKELLDVGDIEIMAHPMYTEGLLTDDGVPMSEYSIFKGYL